MMMRFLGYGLAILLVGTFGEAPAAAEQLQGLTVQAGETWIFKVENGQPVDARKVDGNAQPQQGELKVTLDHSMGTMLSVTNNDETWYNYRAFIISKPGKKGTPTSVCTLMGGGRGAFENWPQAIPAIRIADFTPASEGEMICR